MLYLTNAFSLNMLNFNLDPARAPTVQFIPINYFDVVDALQGGFTSAVGHADTAAVISNLLAHPVEANRVSVSLSLGDSLIVAQYSGPRLPEGTTTLPEGATLTFIRCTVNYW